MNEITDEELILIQLKLEGKTILYGDGVHDDSDAFLKWDEGGTVYFRDGSTVKGRTIPRGKYYLAEYYDDYKINYMNNPTDHFQKKHGKGSQFSNKPFTQ